MDKQTLELLRKQTGLQIELIRRIIERLQPQSTDQAFQLINQFRSIKNETDTDNDDLVIEFLASSLEPQQQIPVSPTEPMISAGVLPQLSYDRSALQGAKTKTGSSNSLVEAMFGSKARVTQDFGKYNPKLEPRSGINWGTDFAASKEGGEQLANPFKSALEVVHVVDGIREGGRGRFDLNSGYGNQVVARRTDTGEYLQLSHLQPGISYRPGDTIEPGQPIGRVGATGNVTGAHLDLEVFDQQGKIKDVADLLPVDEQTPIVTRRGKKEEFVSGRPLAADDQTDFSQVLSQVPEGQREDAKRVVPLIADALKQEGIYSPRTLGYAVATIQAESGFKPVEETLAKPIDDRNRYIAALQEDYSGGKDFRGRGFIQLTHDYNYDKYGQRIGEDLVNNPDRLLDPQVSARVLAAYFKDTGVADAVEKDDLIRARTLIQGQGATNRTFLPKTQEIARTARSYTNAVRTTPMVRSTPKPQIQPSRAQGVVSRASSVSPKVQAYSPAPKQSVARPAPKPMSVAPRPAMSIARVPTPPPRQVYVPRPMSIARPMSVAPRPVPKPAPKQTVVSRFVSGVKRLFGKGGGGYQL